MLGLQNKYVSKVNQNDCRLESNEFTMDIGPTVYSLYSGVCWLHHEIRKLHHGLQCIMRV